MLQAKGGSIANNSGIAHDHAKPRVAIKPNVDGAGDAFGSAQLIQLAANNPYLGHDPQFLAQLAQSYAMELDSVKYENVCEFSNVHEKAIVI
jgi:sugar/nucleoside kinase (ribokinase family)